MICMLLNSWHQFLTLFPTIIGMLLFISRASHNVYSACSQVGLSVSRGDVLKKLHEIARDSQDELSRWVSQHPDKPFDGKVVFDNVNKMARARDATVGHRNIVHCRTSAIVIKLEDVPEGALELSPLLKAIGEICSLTCR